MLDKIVSIGDKIEISKSDFDFLENEESYKSQILEIYSAEKIRISAPIDNGKIVPLSVGDKYYICIYAQTSLYRGKIKIEKRDKDDNQFTIDASMISKLEKLQRRQYFRLKCVIDFKYKSEDNEKKQSWFEGLIIDISGGGIRFISKQKIDVEEHILCKITLENNTGKHIVNVNCKILTADALINDINKYEYRAQFGEIDALDREIIIKYIFDEQRRLRKREKGLI